VEQVAAAAAVGRRSIAFSRYTTTRKARSQRAQLEAEATTEIAFQVQARSIATQVGGLYARTKETP